ncbi:MAG: isoleucine--tRNA ligase [Candidatus Diapherotrites archaeon]|uniref:Isoleucine--tRNA ligase n=2 Tax=Candidatus Iainarchaeum sp. TaxID=3101447 RepID=A0A8T4L8J6_9ARCH|nr:isoleucine--tRNA ligase [Candidatus Diapherotrites archaeon]
MTDKKNLEPFTLQKEEEVKAFWKQAGVPEKVRKQHAGKGKPYYFMDGPPYATGHIHMGTALNKVLKDVALRSKRMEGFDVFDRPGYDTHGLPIEHQIEKELGFKVKADIERFGVKPFVEKCREYATRFIGTMNEEFGNLGVWMDWKNPYLTLSNEYVEAIWWTFKTAYEKDLLYLDSYSVHVCPRCATAVAYNEIEYSKVGDASVYYKLTLKDQPNTHLAVWTTTPWTIPANRGVMVHPDYEYAFVETREHGTLVVAKDLVSKLMPKFGVKEHRVTQVKKGAELVGLRYSDPLGKHMKMSYTEKDLRVIPSPRYVNLTDGTGLVHCAPGHGREDYEEGKRHGLSIACPVDLTGTLKPETGKYAGKRAKIVDAEIVEDLKADGFVLGEEKYVHDYPFCWRCKQALLMLAVPQWFFRVTKLREKMLKENEEVNWVPGWMKDRMKNWLENLGDWPVSRERYWGTPLPIWQCGAADAPGCGHIEVFGSVAELGGKARLPKELNLHKPEIDGITFPCLKCRKEMKRIPHVLDVWFDAGVSSWGALDYSRDDQLFKRYWPADLNIEGTDQVRGWWNSEIITSTICFDAKPFKNIAVHGMVLDITGSKMSKSKGNVIGPAEVIAKHNRDYLRYFLVSESRGEDFNFSWDAFKDIGRFFNILWNTYNFAQMYAFVDFKESAAKAKLNVEDQWILSKMNSLVKKVREAYDSYEYFKAPDAINRFVLEDLSRTYVKLIRDRVGTKDGRGAEETLNYCLVTLARLLAPITPHVTEYVYQHFKGPSLPESIHLLSLPEPEEKRMDAGLEKEMELAMEIAQATLALREEKKLRLRWPLNELVVQSKDGRGVGRAAGILATMCNVKKVSEATTAPKGEYASKPVDELTLHLNTAADERLRDEWEVRELVRRVQELRKEAKLQPGQKVDLLIACDDGKFLEAHRKAVEEETHTRFVNGEGLPPAGEKREKLLDRVFYVKLKP